MSFKNKFLKNIITVIILTLFLYEQEAQAYSLEETSSLRPISFARSRAVFRQKEGLASLGAKISPKVLEEARQKLDGYIRVAIGEGRRRLYEFEIYEVLKILGIDVPEYKIVDNPDTIPELPNTENLVLKVISLSAHKSDISSDDEKIKGVMTVPREEAAEKIKAMFRKFKPKGVMVCSFVEGGAKGVDELSIGFNDAPFGRVILFGEGGSYTNFREDKAARAYGISFSKRDFITYTRIGREIINRKYRKKNFPAKMKTLERLIDKMARFKRYYDKKGLYNIPDFEINPFICTSGGLIIACDAKLKFEAKKPAVVLKPVDRVGKVLHPEKGGIAVIGVVEDPRPFPNIRRLMDNIVDSYPGGKIYWYLNPSYASRPMYDASRPEGQRKQKIPREYRGIPFVEEIPPDCQLCVVVRPGKEGVKVVAERLAKGNAVVLIGAGFEEVKGGEDLAKALKDIIVAADGGASVVGGNAMGGFTSLVDFTFADKSAGIRRSERSNIAFISQSGAFLAAAASSLVKIGTKGHYGISIGNAADLQAADYLEYILNNEPQIKVVAMYLEGSGGGDRLAYLVREAAKKGVFVIIRKGGTTKEGAKAAASHTAAAAVTYDTFKQVLEQAGAIVFADTDDYYLWVDTVNTASYFAAKGMPSGNRVYGLTSGGEDAVTSTSMKSLCDKLRFPAPDSKLAGFISTLKVVNTIKNIQDLTAAIPPKEIMDLLEYVDSSDAYDLLLFAYLRWLPSYDKSLKLIQDIKYRKWNKPLVFIIKDDSREGDRLKRYLRRAGFLVFDTPQRAMLVLNAVFKSIATAEKFQKMEKDIPAISDLPSAESAAPLLNYGKNPTGLEAILTAA